MLGGVGAALLVFGQPIGAAVKAIEVLVREHRAHAVRFERVGVERPELDRAWIKGQASGAVHAAGLAPVPDALFDAQRILGNRARPFGDRTMRNRWARLP